MPEISDSATAGAATSQQSVAFLGLGRMGGPMAGRLVAAGYRVYGYDPSEQARDRAAADGCMVLDSPIEAYERASTLITMLPDERSVSSLAFDSGGLLERWRAGTLWIEMTSSLPSVTRSVAAAVTQAGGELLDAPVSGGVRGAKAGQLTIMVGGEPQTLTRARPFLAPLGARIVHLGEQPGAGDVVKCLNNMLSAVNLTAAYEAIAIAIKEGVDLRLLVDAVEGSTGASNAMTVKVGQFVLNGRHDTGFTIDQYLKDLRIAMAVAAEDAVSPALAETTRELWAGLAGEGYGRRDHTEVVPLLLARLGLRVPAQSPPEEDARA